MEISFGSDLNVINLDEAAKRYGVSLEALKDIIKGKNMYDYSLLDDQMVNKNVLETIQGELAGVQRHDDALKIFERHGIKAYSQALSLIGYKVKWSGLNPENAEIVKL